MKTLSLRKIMGCVVMGFGLIAMSVMDGTPHEGLIRLAGFAVAVLGGYISGVGQDEEGGIE